MSTPARRVRRPTRSTRGPGVGGLSDGGVILSTVEVYNPANNTWRKLSPLLTSGFTLAAGAINGKLYVVGGYGNANAYLTNTQVYTP